MSRGFFGIGVYNIKHECNLGTLWRSATAFNAKFIFTIGKRYKDQSSDTCKTFRHIPLYHYENWLDFNKHRPYNVPLISVEIHEKAHPIKNFTHPESAIYLLGPEDNSITDEILKKSQYIIQIPSKICLNVSVAGSVIMFDRAIKGDKTTSKLFPLNSNFQKGFLK